MNRPLMYRKGDVLRRNLNGRIIERKILGVDTERGRYLVSQIDDFTAVYGWRDRYWPESKYRKVKQVVFQESLNG